LARGHAVTALLRPGGRGEALARLGARCLAVDLLDRTAVARAVAGHDAVVNLATHMRASAGRMLLPGAWRQNDRLRRHGAANLAEAALAGGAARYVQESFALAYPDRGAAWIDESTPLAPGRYNRSLLDAEAAAARFAEGGGAGIVLRFAAFYGPDAMQVRSYADALRRGWAALPGGADRFISSVSHDDAAAAVVAAVLEAPAGVYTVADDEPVTRAVYFGVLAQCLGLAPPRFLPDRAAPLLGSLGRTLARSLRLSNRRLKEATGWRARLPSVREGWPATVAEMRAAGLRL
ncbi:MAG: NAD(P)H-binding protein, partial [Rhodospirillaceae bacterium]|nr:NAD(P)H-binding protein [Rhodospirillaceae bacterium]